MALPDAGAQDSRGFAPAAGAVEQIKPPVSNRTIAPGSGGRGTLIGQMPIFARERHKVSPHGVD